MTRFLEHIKKYIYATDTVINDDSDNSSKVLHFNVSVRKQSSLFSCPLSCGCFSAAEASLYQSEEKLLLYYLCKFGASIFKAIASYLLENCTPTLWAGLFHEL